MFKDITDSDKLNKVKMEKEFQEMVTATVFHDMRTPINSILSSTERLGKYITNEKGKRY